MKRSEPSQRETYFLFQGLLTAVLLLLFIYQYRETVGWMPRFVFLSIFLGAPLITIRLASPEFLSRWWMQTGLFLFDAGMASITLVWTQPQSDFFLLYVLIIFGTSITRNFTQSLVLGVIIALLYLVSGWKPHSGWPEETGFWLKFDFLCVATSLMAILSRDTRQAQQEQEKEYRERIIQIERLATLGQIAGEIAHRIKSPLTTIMVNAEILSYRRNQSKKTLEEMTQILEAARHCQEILKNLLNLGRIEEIAFTPLDLKEPVESALKSLAPQIRQKSIQLEALGLGDPKIVLGEASLLHEAVAAVIQNAIDSVSARGNILLRLETRQDPWWKWWAHTRSYAIVVEDDGKGIDPWDLEHIFQPFFSTKGKQGSGLGLSAALRILQKHQGTITAYSRGARHGARLTLVLPALNEPRGFRSARAGRSGGRSKSR